MKDFVNLGVILILLGFAIVVFGSLLQGTGEAKGGKTGTKVAIGGFIGPIPFGWANDKQFFYPLLGVMTALAVFWFIMRMVR
jgi:uncharacterized membrane protein